MKTVATLLVLIALALPHVQATEPGRAIVSVTSTANSGAGSLRQAITMANDSGLPSTIRFDLPGAGPHVIEPTSLLPALTVPTLIDGLSQSGADCSTWPPTLKVELSGAGLSSGSSIGLRLNPGSDGSQVRGLVIRGFDNDNASTGLWIASSNNHVACNFIGTDVTGTQSVGNTRGINLTSNAQHNVIGLLAEWTGEHERNLISGNANIAITTTGNATNDNRISGNWIGVDVTGNAGLGGSIGISIGAMVSGAPTERIIIGYDGLGDPVLMRNIISGHSTRGISFGGHTRTVHVAGNYIGLNAQGNAAVPNGSGIEASGGHPSYPHLHHVIGWDGTPGQRTAQRNVISGNSFHGVSLSFYNNYGNEHAVVGNWIGTDAQGDTAIPNGMYGLSLGGGSAPSRVLVHGNRIANNSSGGIQLHANSPNLRPDFWSGVTHPDLPNLDSIDNCLTDNTVGINRTGNAAPLAVTFTDNWWGADNGPGGSGGGSGDSIPGSVAYQPFLLEPPEHCGNLSDAPALHLSPTALDFGEVEMGSSAGPLNATLQNLGNGTATALDFQLSGSGFSVDAGSCASSLPPNENCQFSVSFTPQSVGAANSEVTILASGEEQTTLALAANTIRVIAPDANGILYVDQMVSSGNQSGSSWTNALPGLRIALDWAASEWEPAEGDLQIWVAEGTYTPTDDPGDLEASLTLVDQVSLYGGFSGVESSLVERDWTNHPTVLSGNVGTANVYNVLFAENVGPNTRVDGFIIRGGRALSHAGGIPALGGGIHMLNANPVMSNLVFTDNRARAGGGAYMDTSEPLFINVLFHDNLAVSQGGGGVFNNINSHARYINCVFHANFAYGAIFPEAQGGGMFNWNGSSPEIINSIFWGNDSDVDEPQVHGPDGGFNGFTNEARIAHSILEGGMPENTIDNGNNLFDEPGFVDADSGNFNLESGSPAVNAGDPDTDLTLFFGGPDDPLDLAGQPRVYPGLIETIDIGTHELQGNPPLPLLTLSSSALDFGDVAAGQTSSPLSVAITNSGTATLLIDSISAVPLPFAAAGGSCATAPISLDPAQSCELEFVYSPTAVGTETASLTLNSNALSSPDLLAFQGRGTAALIDTDPDSIAVTLVLGESSEQRLDIGNPGNQTLDWAVSISSDCGSGTPVDWISFDTSTGSTLPSTATAFDFTIDTAGLDSGTFSAAACIASNAFGQALVEVPIELTVITPALGFAPASLDFGNQQIHTPSPESVVTLHNSGAADATELVFDLPDPFHADTSACGPSLPAGANCQISVSFLPVSTGPVNGQLGVSSAQGPAAVLELSGNGVDERPDEIFADRFELH